jgi:hypothetical protein
MTATAASTSSTATKPIGALINYTQIAKAVQMTKSNTASHSRPVRALIAGAAPPIPAVGSWVARQAPAIAALSIGPLAQSLIGDRALKIPRISEGDRVDHEIAS